ncbi:hypothetical protein BC835DRAFT_1404046 [Cytidiella melzeri]|nr:hypothetical protein BC835DRAFT_1404046 [Cytidiella melzeri]
MTCISEDPLRGAESQRMRTYFSSHEMIPSRDLDDYGKLLFLGDIAGVKQECARRVAALREGEVDEEEATIRAGKEQADLRWGPTRVPIYDLLLLARELVPSARCNILRVARYLIDDAKVPVGSKDLSGTTAIAHAIGTKPTFDPELAQILYDAGEDVNGRNRYGCTAGHDIAMVGTAVNLAHGGNVDIKDNDGMTPRVVLENMSLRMRGYLTKGLVENMIQLLRDEDTRRTRMGNKCCTFCGQEPVTLLVCSRCKKARYCVSTPSRSCQRGDWPFHKRKCVTVAK